MLSDRLVLVIATLCLVSCTLSQSGTSTTVTTDDTTTTVSTIPVTTTSTRSSSPLSPTTVPAGTTTLAPSRSCVDRPDHAIDPDARGDVVITGDIDGDGFDDVVTGYLLGSSEPTEATGAALHVELASGWGTELRLDQIEQISGSPVVSRPERIVEMSDDPLVVVAVAWILPGELYGLFRFEGCALGLVTTVDGIMPDLWVGLGPSHDDWFVCRPDSVAMLELGYVDADASPRVYESGEVRTFSYDESRFIDVGTTPPEVDFPSSRDAVVAVYPPCAT